MFENFTLIAGPCALEDDALNLEIGHALAAISKDLALPIVFKASYDKANRSKADSPRGPGLEEGLERLARVKAETGLPLITDIHEPFHAEKAAEVVDVLQIPAFLCRQTDLLVAAGKTGRVVSIKKGQWMAPEEMTHAVEKTRLAGASEVVVTERGTFFGYGNLVVDMRSFRRIREATGVRAIFDGTHSVQRPGLAAGSSGGDPEPYPVPGPGRIGRRVRRAFPGNPSPPGNRALRQHQHAPAHGASSPFWRGSLRCGAPSGWEESQP